MTDENYKDMVINHDKHIDMLSSSIVSLSTSMDSSNQKLDTVIDALTHQNVIVERMNNMDINIAESFNRAWHRLGKLEDTAANSGCEASKILRKDQSVSDEKAKVANKRINDLEDVVHNSDNITSGTVKWVLGLLLFYSVAFGGYVVTTIHDNETDLSTYIAKDNESHTSTVRQLDDIVSILRDRDGKVVTYSTPHNITVAVDKN